MCGLTGFCDFNKRLALADLQSAADCLKHRGPDDSGTVVFNTPRASIGLGHRRLSILDLSAAASQPMYSDDKSIVLILNGEIYNFLEIRKELEGLGHSFHTRSDTEVIIHSYLQWGIEGVHRFIGMFAFVLYDQKKELLFMLRDRAGVKPLHFYKRDNCLLFASELKAITSYPVFKKEINEEAVSLFFKYGYIRYPHTIYKNTWKVQPGHYVRVDLAKGTSEEVKYYDVLDHYNKPKLKISEEEAIDEVDRLFTSAFQYRMVSDVPVGIFLSGGYDSSVVSAVLQKNNKQQLKTFTIGYHEKKYNEADHAKKVAGYLGTDHHEYYCTTKEAQDIFPMLADIYDEPFGDSSAIPTTLVSRFARQQVTVALSADAGDEVFAGYNRYPQLLKLNRVMSRTPQPVKNTLAGVLPGIPFRYMPFFKERTQKMAKLAEVFATQNEKDISDTLSRHYTNRQLLKLLPHFNQQVNLYDDVGRINNENDFINTLLALDYKTYMVDDILVKVDRATMSVGLEGREPLLDHRIVEFVAQLPSSLKYHNGEKKYLLKKVAHRYIPEALLNRPKTGFGLPVYEWFRNDLREYLYYYLNEEQLSKHDFIDTAAAIKLRDDFISGKNNSEMQIWLLLIFQMWWNRWM